MFRRQSGRGDVDRHSLAADQIPAPGHYCFVATVGCNDQPAPNPALLNSFPTFQDYENFISNNPNVTWRNFNVVQVHMGHKRDPVPLPFI